MTGFVEFIGTSEIVIWVIFNSIFLILFWRICSKAGHPGWYSLAVFVPLLNLTALYVLAFTKWPVETKT